MDVLTEQAETTVLEGKLAGVVGAEHVLTDPAEREFYSTDIYSQRAIADFVVRPGSAEEVSSAVRLATGAGYAVVPRGGGLSYTNGYTPTRTKTVLFDLGRLNRILEINDEDMFVTVECNVTWSELYEALKAKGLRTPYFGTASGFSSTIGGAMSQHSSHFGSTQYGLSADSCLGLEVVLANGDIVRTGSWSSKYRPTPFFRNLGPDLTGLFLGDTGALGVKTKVTLRLIPFPPVQRYGAYAFDSYDDMISAMIEIGKAGLTAECGGWDPALVVRYVNRNPALKEDLKYLAGVTRSGSSFLSGLKDAARIALTGRGAFKDVAYLLNIAIDETTTAAGDEKLKQVEAIALKHNGRSVEPTFPRAHRGTPFLYPNSVLGPGGERWSPTHGLSPNSRVLEISHLMFDFFDSYAEQMAEHEIEWVLITTVVGNNGVLIEPMLYWKDRRNLFHERWVKSEVLDKMPLHPERPDTASLVHTIRTGVMDLFMKNGCTHFQAGKLYPYKAGREPQTYALLEGIKAAVDPRGLMNPGSLGLGE